MNIFKPMDLTKKSPIKCILLFTLPILLSYLLQQVYTIADAAICGQFLNSNEVAGVNNTTNLVFLVLQFVLGITAGFSVITSNLYGQNNISGIRRSFATQIKLAFVVSIAVTIISVFLINPLLSLIGLRESVEAVQNEIYNAAYIYILIIYLGIFTQVFYNLICSFLRSVGDSTTPLLFLLLSSVINIVLDLLFITIFKWGVPGAAIATVIAQGISAIGCFIYTFIKYKEYRLSKSDFKIDFGYGFKHLKMGLPLALQFSILSIGLIVMQSGIVQFDSNELGQVIRSDAQNGFGAAIKLNNLLMCPYNALGTTMLTYCGQNLGANNFKRIKKGINGAMLIEVISFVILGGIGLLLTINGSYLYLFYSSDKITPEAINFGNAYLYCDMCLYFILGALIVFRNSIQGLGKSLFPFLAGIGELAARTSVCLTLPSLLNGGKVTVDANVHALFGLAIADPFAWICACLFLFIGAWLYVYSKKAPERLGLY